MANKKKEQPEQHDGFEVIEDSLSKAELLIENNQKQIATALVAILLIVGGYIGYKKFIKEPKELSAQSEMFMAEQYFEVDSFNLALNGSGSHLGFLQIIDEYGSTTSGKLAEYYAGVCYYKLQQYDNAIDYLDGFSTSSELVGPIAIGLTGDAYSEKGEYDKALSYYLKAAGKDENNLTAPVYLMKAGRVYEELKQFGKALEVYQRIKQDYSKSTEARNIDKYIKRVELKG